MNQLLARQALDTPWKTLNEIDRFLVYPGARLIFMMNGIPWGRNWRIYGIPTIQKHRGSHMSFGAGLGLRSTVRSNPLAPNHPVTLVTWSAGACLEIGSDFAMTGGVLCAAERISIGANVAIGSNTTIVDTDFHPLDPQERRRNSSGMASPVIIEDDVFIGMNCVVLKGVHLGQGCVVGAGSVVTKDVPSWAIVAGNPARTVGIIHDEQLQ
jgi:acetyltransferase-like isoleucine patch superfamily enzyme